MLLESFINSFVFGILHSGGVYIGVQLGEGIQNFFIGLEDAENTYNIKNNQQEISFNILIQMLIKEFQYLYFEDNLSLE